MSTAARSLVLSFALVAAPLLAQVPTGPGVLQTRQSDAAQAMARGDLRGALALAQSALDDLAKALPDDHPDLQAARLALAAPKKALGDLRGALKLEEKALDVCEKTLPHGHPQLLTARQRVAATRKALGDLQSALTLQENVFTLRSRALADDHPDLQTARLDLARTKLALGDLQAALALEETVFAIRSRTLPDDDPDLQDARLGLAETKRALGDLLAARALEEKVLAVRTRSLPDDHPDLQAARSSLAVTKRMFGDWMGALALDEKVLAVRSASLPDDHPDLLSTRLNIARSKHDLGDPNTALPLAQGVLAIRLRTLPDDHPDLQDARLAVAATKRALGDLEGALALEEQVLAVRSRSLPNDHPDLQSVRLALAATKRALGDPQAAAALGNKVLATQSRTLPDDHADLQRARTSLAQTKQALGDPAGALQLTLARAAAARSRVTTSLLAPREVTALAQGEQAVVGELLALHDATAAEQRHALVACSLLTAETLRGAELRAARLRVPGHVRDPKAAASLRSALLAAAAEVGAATRASGEDAFERLARAVSAKEEIERRLAQLSAGDAASARTDLQAIAARIPAGAVAVSIVDADPTGLAAPGAPPAERRLTALVLDRDARTALRPLGATATVDALVARIREALAAPDPSADGDLAAALRGLRGAVLDPVLAELPADTNTLLVALPAVLQLVPLDALPLDSGEPVGTATRIVQLPSLLDLLDEATPAVGDAPSLCAFGGADFGDVGPAGAAQKQGRAPSRFARLAETGAEVEAIGAAFSLAFPNGSAAKVLGADATAQALLDRAPRATFLHVATHAWFAPESPRAAGDAGSALARFEPGRDDRVSALAPFALTGLALAGANTAPDARGMRTGVVTGEELAALDLSRCALATLSAADGAVGVCRAGQGFASLRTALQLAGARRVLAALWPVSDERTMELMTDFYARMWKDHEDPHQALWAAKLALREKGAPFRDWAGWVLSGR